MHKSLMENSFGQTIPAGSPCSAAQLIFADRVELAMLAMVASKRTEEVFNGERNGTRFRTARFVIVEENETVRIGDQATFREVLDLERCAIRDRASLGLDALKGNPAESVLMFAGNGELMQTPIPEAIRTVHEFAQGSLAALNFFGESLRQMAIWFTTGQVFERCGVPACWDCPYLFRWLNQQPVPCTNCRGYGNFCRVRSPFGPARCRLTSAYATERGIAVDDAVVELADQLGIDEDGPFEPIPIGLAGWARARDVQVAPDLWNRDETLEFRTRNGEGVECAVRFPQGAQADSEGLPTTAWKCGDSAATCMLNVPITKNVPLWRGNEIADRVGDSVVLCSSLLDASRRSRAGTPKSEIVTAWLGGADLIDEVDFSVLRGHPVTVEIGHPETSLSGNDEARELVRDGLRICSRLRRARAGQITIRTGAAGLLAPEDGDPTTSEAAAELGLDAFLELAGTRYRLHAAANRLRASINPRIEVFADCGHQEIPDPEFIVAPILEEGAVSMFYGPKGTGKTALAMSWAYTAALGESFVGAFNAPKPVGVLYLEGESGEAGLGQRINHAREHFKVKRGESSLMWHKSVSLNLYTDDGRAWVDRQIREIDKASAPGERIRLLVIDNLTSMCGAKDYASGWDRFFAWCCRLREQGLHVLVVGHTAKDGKLLGSGMKANNADNLIRIERWHEMETEDENHKIRLKTAAELRREAEERDPDLLQSRVVFEKLRNNPFPEAKRTINLDHRITRNIWQVIKGSDRYRRQILSEQIQAGRTDAEMALFWGTVERSLRTMRENLGLPKNPAKGRRKDHGAATDNSPETETQNASQE